MRIAEINFERWHLRHTFLLKLFLSFANRLVMKKKELAIGQILVVEGRKPDILI